jgi:hypothetical protein
MLRTVKRWWRQWWVPWALCLLVASINIASALQGREPWQALLFALTGGFFLGAAATGLLHSNVLCRCRLDAERLVTEAEAEIRTGARLWARDSIIEALTETRSLGIQPENVRVILSVGDMDPPHTAATEH